MTPRAAHAHGPAQIRAYYCNPLLRRDVGTSRPRPPKRSRSLSHRQECLVTPMRMSIGGGAWSFGGTTHYFRQIRASAGERADRFCPRDVRRHPRVSAAKSGRHTAEGLRLSLAPYVLRQARTTTSATRGGDRATNVILPASVQAVACTIILSDPDAPPVTGGSPGAGGCSP